MECEAGKQAKVQQKTREDHLKKASKSTSKGNWKGY